MTQLQTVIRKHGRSLRQIWRNEHTAIYHYFGGYEVIVVKKAPAEVIFGKSYPQRELYPSDEDWGTLAITRPETDSLDYLKKRADDLYQNNRINRKVSGGSRA